MTNSGADWMWLLIGLALINMGVMIWGVIKFYYRRRDH